jgi:hypothetical protein
MDALAVQACLNHTERMVWSSSRVNVVMPSWRENVY